MVVPQSFLFLTIVTLLISLVGPADAWNRIMFDLFEQPGCPPGTTFKKVREADYAKGKRNVM